MASTSQVASFPTSVSNDSLSESDNSIWFGKPTLSYQRAEKKFNQKYFADTIQHPNRRDTIILKSNVEGTTSDSEADTTAPNSPNPHSFLTQELVQLNPTSQFSNSPICHTSASTSPFKGTLNSPNSSNQHLLRSPLSTLSLPASPLRFYSQSLKKESASKLDSPFLNDSNLILRPTFNLPLSTNVEEIAAMVEETIEVEADEVMELEVEKEEMEEGSEITTLEPAQFESSTNGISQPDSTLPLTVDVMEVPLEEAMESDLERSIDFEDDSDGGEADEENSIDMNGDLSFDTESDVDAVVDSSHFDEQIKQLDDDYEVDSALHDEVVGEESTEEGDSGSMNEVERETELSEDQTIKFTFIIPVPIEEDSQELSGTDLDEDPSVDELNSSTSVPVILEFQPEVQEHSQDIANIQELPIQSVQLDEVEESETEIIQVDISAIETHPPSVTETEEEESDSLEVVPVIEKLDSIMVEESTEIIEVKEVDEMIHDVEPPVIKKRGALDSPFIESAFAAASVQPASPTDSSQSLVLVDVDEDSSQDSTSPTPHPSTPGAATVTAPPPPNFTPSITPVSSYRQNQPALTAPTRRQISTITSVKTIPITAETGKKRRSGLVAIVNSSVDSKRSGIKVVPKFRPITTSIPLPSPPQDANPPKATKSVVSSTQPIVTVPFKPVFASKMVRPVPSKLPTTLKRPTVAIKIAKAEVAILKIDSAIKVDSTTSTSTSRLPASSSSSRPNSAASSSSSNTISRPRIVTSSSAPTPRMGPIPAAGRPVTTTLARALPGPKRVLPGAIRVGSSSIRPNPPLVTVGPLVSVAPTRSALPALSRSTSTSRLPASGVARSRVLAPLIQTHSAPSFFVPSPTSIPNPPPVASTSTLRVTTLPTLGLSRSISSSNLKSPEKRRALRTGQTSQEEEIRLAAAIKAAAETAALNRITTARTQASVVIPSNSTLQRSNSIQSLQTLSSNPISETPAAFRATPRLASKELSIVNPIGEEVSILTDSISVDKEVALEVFGTSQEVLEVKPARSKRSRTKVVEEVSVPIPATRTRRSATSKASSSATTSEAEAVATSPPRSKRGIRIVPEVEEEEILPVTSTRYLYNPAPALTQEELTQLTQRNTVKNKAHFNKLDVQTTYRDEVRPPSPSTKVRKTLSTSAAKGGREERAKNRRSALRSSIDGSGIELLKSELEAEGIEVEHFRAAGDEELFQSPVRPIIKKGRKKSKASLIGKRVKWDRVLVYSSDQVQIRGEGEEGEKEIVLETDSILKQISLDSFGNSKATGNSFAKPTYVVIQRVLYKGEE